MIRAAEEIAPIKKPPKNFAPEPGTDISGYHMACARCASSSNKAKPGTSVSDNGMPGAGKEGEATLASGGLVFVVAFFSHATLVGPRGAWIGLGVPPCSTQFRILSRL